MMNQEAKKKWRCKTCKTVSNVKSGVSNVTTRRKPNPDCAPTSSPLRNAKEQECDEPSLNFSHSPDSHVLTDHNTSDESISTPTRLSTIVQDSNDITTIPQMKNIISQMSLTLKSTQKEVRNLTLERNNLRKIVNELTAENKLLKSLPKLSPAKDCSPGHSKETKKSESLPHNNTSALSSSPVTKLVSNRHDIDTTLLIVQEKITNLQIQLLAVEEKIMNLNGKTMTSQDVRQKHIAKTNDKAYTTLESQNRMPGREIYIFGSQQCVGLAAEVSSSRSYTQYEKYRLIAETKPYAPSSEIIKNCKTVKLRRDDKIIICIGENDNNINYVLSHLYRILDIFNRNKIIVLGVKQNRFLDIIKLNKAIKNTCKLYKNCYYVDYNSSKLLSDTIKNINYTIDSWDYADKYLNPKEIRKQIANIKSSKQQKQNLDKPKKGTIPYYFKKPTQDVSKTNVILKKGTIPYYFSVIKNRSSFFRVSKSASNKT